MTSVYLIVPYFEKLSDYFALYLHSLAQNDFLHVHLFTDCDLRAHTLPFNLHVHRRTLEECTGQIRSFLEKEYGPLPIGADVFINADKLCDYRPLYAVLFGAELNLDDHDFVGWGTINVIYGRLSEFLDLHAHVLGGAHGHFTAMRNQKEYINLYKKIPDLLTKLLDDKCHALDETVFHPYSKSVSLA